LLMSVASTGVIAIVAWIVWRRLSGKPWRKPGSDPFDSFPYGIAIGIGGVIAAI